jgi:hypothetical protein
MILLKNNILKCIGFITYRALVGKPDGRRPIGRSRRRW